jgi:hypothetical protein
MVKHTQPSLRRFPRVDHGPTGPQSRRKAPLGHDQREVGDEYHHDQREVGDEFHGVSAQRVPVCRLTFQHPQVDITINLNLRVRV